MRTRSGTVAQGAMSFQASDYGDKHITYPVLGMVLNVLKSDDPLNYTSGVAADGRGHQVVARVLVLNDGSDSPWILPNVVVLPPGSTGYDNFSEELPKGISSAIDDAELANTVKGVSRAKLDGDLCVVSFIGGSINQPFMHSWWPHTGNAADNATSVHGRRSVKRFQGTRLAITSKGTVLLDTTEANQPLRNGERKSYVEGGDVRVTLKNNKQLEFNWNQSVYGDPAEPDFLWADVQPQTRKTDSTKVLITKDLASVSAGEDVQLTAQRNNVSVTAKKDVAITAQDNSVTVNGTQSVVLSTPDVRLGGTEAVDAVMKGTSYAAGEQAMLTALAVWLPLASAYIVATPGFAASPPVAQSAYTAATSALTTMLTSTFVPATYLSVITKTK